MKIINEDQYNRQLTYLQSLKETDILLLKEYSIYLLKRATDHFRIIDSKASSIISLISIVFTLSIYLVYNNLNAIKFVTILFYPFVICSILSLLFSFLTITLKKTIEPLSANDTINWFLNNKDNQIDSNINRNIIYFINNSEESYLSGCKVKTTLLMVGQIFEFLSIILLVTMVIIRFLPT